MSVGNNKEPVVAVPASCSLNVRAGTRMGAEASG